MSNKALACSILAIIAVAAGAFVFWRLNQQKQNQEHFSGQASRQSSLLPAATPPPVASETPRLNPKVEMSVKNYGSISLELDINAAPKTVENFVKLANQGFYNGLTFHRIAKDFVIQGGDPKGDGSGGVGYTLPAEIKLTHKKGSLAMARLPDQFNPKKESSGSQFYIALEDLPQLDGGYTVFGQVINGLDVVEKIGQAPIKNAAPDGPPQTPIIIESVKIIK